MALFLVFAFALLQQSGFDKHLTIDMKDDLATTVVAKIAKDAGFDCTYPKDYTNLKVSVFAKDVSARSLLDRIGSTLGLDGKIEAGRYVYAPGPELKRGLVEEYIGNEGLLLSTIIQARLEALARLTLQPFGTVGQGRSIPNSSDEETDPGAWALNRISQPAYYALGVAYRIRYVTPIRFVHVSDARLGSPKAMCEIVPGLPMMPFLVGTPTEVPTLETYIDDNSRAINGTLIAYGFLTDTAEIRVSVIHGTDIVDRALSKVPFLFAKPPKELAKLSFVNMLNAWSMNVEDMPKELFEKASPVDGKREDSGYFDGRISLSDKLERLHLQTGLPIVATSFRTPALDQNVEVAGSAKEAVESLVSKEKCFVRAENGFLLVRHPAYWMFRRTEPPEPLVRKLEDIAKQRPLTIGEYGDLAASVALSLPDWGGGLANGAFPLCYNRLLNSRGLLLRFDSTPLSTGFPALLFLGTLDRTERAALLEGAWWDSDKPRRAQNSSGYATDYVAHRLASAGPLFGAAMTNRYLTPIEAGMDFLKYRNLVATSPQEAGGIPILDVGKRARYVWMEPSSEPNSYTMKVGFKDMVTAIYDVSWSWHPPKDPDPDDDDGGR